MEIQRMGIVIWERIWQRVRIEEYDVGGQLLAILSTIVRIVVHMVNDVIEELFEPGHGTQAGIAMVDEFVRGGGPAHACPRLRWEADGRIEYLPFREVFEVLGYRFQRDGKGPQGVEKTLRKGLGSWWRDAYIYPSKNVSLKTKCQLGDQPCLQHSTKQ